MAHRKVVDLIITYNFAFRIFSIGHVVFPEMVINRLLPLKAHHLLGLRSPFIYFSFHFYNIFFHLKKVSSCYYFSRSQKLLALD